MTPPQTASEVAPPPSLMLREPVRVLLYGMAVLVAAVLVVLGVITQDVADYIGAALLEVLGLASAAEAIRASVYSPASVSLAARRTARAVLLQTGSVDAAAIVRDLDPVRRHAA